MSELHCYGRGLLILIDIDHRQGFWALLTAPLYNDSADAIIWHFVSIICARDYITITCYVTHPELSRHEISCTA